MKEKGLLFSYNYKNMKDKIEATIVYQKDEKTIIRWSHDGGFGYITISYNGQGGYNIYTENLGLKKTMDILQAVNFSENLKGEIFGVLNRMSSFAKK